MDKFKQVNGQEINDSYLDDIFNEKVKLSDEEARLEILKLIDEIEIAQVISLQKNKRYYKR